MAEHPSPLAGVRVLDFSRAIAGPYPARILADLGADVVKVEPPDGDLTDQFGRMQGGRSGLYAQMNAGKRNVQLDLAAAPDAELAVRLAAAADVVVENFRVGVMARLGLDYATLAAANPRLIMLSVTGFGQSSPEASRRAFAPVLHAESGLLVRTARFNGEAVADIAFNAADTLTGLHGAIAVLAALRLRDTTGQGQHIDMSMLAALAASDDYIHYALDDIPAAPSSGLVFDLPSGPLLLAGDIKFLWWLLSKRVGLVDEGGGGPDEKRLRRAGLLRDWMATYADRAELVKLLEDAGVTWADVKAPEDILDNATFRARPPYAEVPDGDGGHRRVVNLPYRFSAATSEVRGAPSLPDADRAAVISDWLSE